ncbi:hypothetical protein AMS68_001689 [Peltaster fructicola]|uniref:Uncharacterized protein n=1 Tax=Peltaster fructicola TaxID=286661 RepID=A0A6H0XN38_9PEZI|nr:hypothetical protein AMS68_001689 [Peltaster fructicola]
MSSVNADAATPASGEFSAKIAPQEPLQTSGHQPGKLVGNDAVPEFHVQTLPAGTAPPEHTFKPNNAQETPVDPENAQGVASASDTIVGATSGDVHKGLGHPGSGQTSAELKGHNVDKKGGIEARGGTASAADLVDERDPNHADQRALEREDGGPKNTLGGAPAQELEPEKST